jgi:hypothetical protein
LTLSRIATGSLIAALAVTSLAPRPALADGAASTRNIIFGAAAIGGTLLILNHNKKVHEKYAEKDRLQAQTQAQANNAEAAYESEREAYSHEAALNQEYQKEVAYQHHMVVMQQRQIASLTHSLQVAKAQGAGSRTVGFTQAAAVAAPVAAAAPAHQAPASQRTDTRTAQMVSYGWGTY